MGYFNTFPPKSILVFSQISNYILPLQLSCIISSSEDYNVQEAAINYKVKVT